MMKRITCVVLKGNYEASILAHGHSRSLLRALGVKAHLKANAIHESIGREALRVDPLQR
jgi:hypothetical protein